MTEDEWIIGMGQDYRPRETEPESLSSPTNRNSIADTKIPGPRKAHSNGDKGHHRDPG